MKEASEGRTKVEKRMEENYDNINIDNGIDQEGDEIDFLELGVKLWRNRKAILKWCAIGAVVGLVIGFSLPKTYTVGAMLAPETSDPKANSGMSSLASMVGVNLNNSVDAINVEMFPDVVHSVPFIYNLFDLEVSTKDGKLTTTLLDYMKEHQKSPWWSCVFSAPGKAIGWTMSLLSKKENETDGPLVMENLPKKERNVVKYFSENLSVMVDSKKTGKAELSLVMQDPLVAATVLNAVINDLKAYMSEYRTSKARQDVDNLSVICAERKAEYYAAQQAYAAYSDANKNVILQSAQAERERLQQEMNLAYQVYSQVATQLETARIQEQQAKPVFTIVEPVTVPIQKYAPSKAKILVIWTFLLGCAAAAWILFGKKTLDTIKTELNKQDE